VKEKANLFLLSAHGASSECARGTPALFVFINYSQSKRGVFFFFFAVGRSVDVRLRRRDDAPEGGRHVQDGDERVSRETAEDGPNASSAAANPFLSASNSWTAFGT